MKRVYLIILLAIIVEVALLFLTDMGNSMKLSLGTYFIVLGGLIFLFSLTDKESTRVEDSKPKQN